MQKIIHFFVCMFSCRITHASLNAAGEEFLYANAPNLVAQKCSNFTTTLWPIRGILHDEVESDQNTSEALSETCNETYDIGLAFLTYFWQVQCFVADLFELSPKIFSQKIHSSSHSFIDHK